MDLDTLEHAIEFAKRAHGDQQRKYTGEPYWHHLRSVADIVASVPHDYEMLAAAWLHDVLEDTPTTIGELRSAFGNRVTMIVLDLTDCSSPVINRKHRKEIDRGRLSCSGPDVQTIKLADLIDNTGSIVARDKNFARVYLAEKEALLEVLTKGDPTLRERAYETLRTGQRELVQWKLGQTEAREDDR